MPENSSTPPAPTPPETSASELRACDRCGKPYRPKPYRLARGQGRYCSASCTWPAAERVCQQCGTVFRARPSDVARGKARFCGKGCADVAKVGVSLVPGDERFWANVDKEGPVSYDGTRCWQWAAGPSEGYGLLRINGVQEGTHRISWRLHFGEIPAGLFVCHHCDNPRCVRPEHLFLGTDGDNIRDAKAKGRLSPPPRNDTSGENNTFHRLTWGKVREIRRLRDSLPPRDLAARFNVSKSTISRVLSGRCWREERVP